MTLALHEHGVFTRSEWATAVAAEIKPAQTPAALLLREAERPPTAVLARRSVRRTLQRDGRFRVGRQSSARSSPLLCVEAGEPERRRVLLLLSDSRRVIQAAARFWFHEGRVVRPARFWSLVASARRRRTAEAAVRDPSAEAATNEKSPLSAADFRFGPDC